MKIHEGDALQESFRLLQVTGHTLWPFQCSGQVLELRPLAEKLNVFVVVYLDYILIYTNDPGQGYVEVV